MAHTVIGFFRNSTEAYNAVDILKNRGFDDNNLDVSSNSGSYENSSDQGERTGKVGSFFKSLFGNDDEVDRYSRFAGNNSLVTVHAFSAEEAERAADILDDCGAIDIDEKEYSGSAYGERESSFSSDQAGGSAFSERDSSLSSDQDFDRSTTGFSSDKDFDRTSEASIPIIEEQVNVGKREVRRGGVRLRSRIIERPVEETLRLREERVHVERNPVDRDASEADLDSFHEETIEVTEYGEEPIVSKKARVVEEVRVGKEVNERRETIRETQRRTEVDVEDFDQSDDDK